MEFLYFFVPFWNQNGIIKNEKFITPFWFQKCTKKCKNFMKIIFSENMDSQLSKDVPTMFRLFLEQITASDVVWSKIEKVAIWRLVSNFVFTF